MIKQLNITAASRVLPNKKPFVFSRAIPGCYVMPTMYPTSQAHQIFLGLHDLFSPFMITWLHLACFHTVNILILSIHQIKVVRAPGNVIQTAFHNRLQDQSLSVWHDLSCRPVYISQLPPLTLWRRPPLMTAMADDCSNSSRVSMVCVSAAPTHYSFC